MTCEIGKSTKKHVTHSIDFKLKLDTYMLFTSLPLPKYYATLQQGLHILRGMNLFSGATSGEARGNTKGTHRCRLRAPGTCVIFNGAAFEQS